MKRTLKVKITVWFACILMAVSALALFALYSVSKSLLVDDQRANIKVAISEFSKKLSDADGQLKVSAGAHFYERGVYRCVFDSSGKLLQGQLPEEWKTVPVTFAEGTVREQHYEDGFYLEYDASITLASGTYWVKGIAPMNDEMRLINVTVKGGVVLALVLTVVCVAGVYLVVYRALSPVEKIRKTAAKIASGSDLSQRIQVKRDKDEIHRLAITFDQMLDKIEQTVTREKQFSADVAHELRTPIAVILSQCDYARSCAKSTEEYREALETIDRQASRMEKLVTELLTISRMENNTLGADFEVIDISELLDLACDNLEETHRSAVLLQREIEPGIMARADRELLIRLWINLITNAYQYSREQGTVTVSLSVRERNAVFRVTDTGIGISEEDLPKIWDRFFRADRARSVTDNNSMGLGLSMVKWIAQCHKGSLKVESKLGEGSCFTFTFPLRSE